MVSAHDEGPEPDARTRLQDTDSCGQKVPRQIERGTAVSEKDEGSRDQREPSITGLNAARSPAMHTLAVKDTERPRRAAVGARRCHADGCPWRGICPVHDVPDKPSAFLARLVSERPFGPGWTVA